MISENDRLDQQGGTTSPEKTHIRFRTPSKPASHGNRIENINSQHNRNPPPRQSAKQDAPKKQGTFTKLISTSSRPWECFQSLPEFHLIEFQPLDLKQFNSEHINFLSCDMAEFLYSKKNSRKNSLTRIRYWTLIIIPVGLDIICCTGISLGQFLRTELTRGYQLEHDEERYSARREKIYSFMKIPRELEKFMAYGFFQCADSFLFVYTFLPLRFVMALWAVVTRPLMRCLRGKKLNGKKGERILRPAEVCDLLKGVVVVGCWAATWRVDTSMMYHLVKSQSVIKLYIFYNMLEVGDRLFSAFGQDTIDALLWTATEPRAKSHSNHTRHLGTLPHLLFAFAYVLLHSILVLFQATTLNVAINSNNKALLTIMMSNNFVELKGSVFKKFDKNNLFQVSCSDVRERFHLAVLLLAVCLQTMKEYAWKADRLIVLLPDCILVLVAEVLVDWVKHAFITRFNELRSTVYRDYTVSLAYDMAQTRQETAFSDQSDLVARRMGFIPLPLGVAMARVLCTTLTPSARPANIILMILAYLVLISLRVLNSLVILGKACDLIASHSHSNATDSSATPTPQGADCNNVDTTNPTLAMAIFSNSAVSLNNVCLNEAILKSEKSMKGLERPEGSIEAAIPSVSKNVVRAGSEPLLPQ